MKILSIDPGSRYVAMVVRDGDDLDCWAVLDRREHADDPSLEAWVRAVVLAASHEARDHGPDWIVVEAVTAPNPHVGMTNPEAIIETAAVLGGIVTEFVDALVVPTGNYGPTMPNRRILVAAYPDDLVGPRETTGSGKSPRQHARAAWDMAQAAAPKIRALTRGDHR